MLIRPLTPEDSNAYSAIRREMLADAPWAFSSSLGVDSSLDPAVVAQRLREPGQAIVGAFGPDGELVGAAGLRRHTSPKMSHRALIWGVYVKPAARSGGLAARILAATLEVARSWPGVDSVGLSVNERATTAQRLYSRLGFAAWGREPKALMLDGRAYDEIHMVLFLNQR